MDQAVKLLFTTHELKCINAVRLFHQVTFVSELYNVYGTKIRSQWYMGETDGYYSPKPLCIRQTKPDMKSYILWQQLLNSFTAVSSQDYHLLSPLGHWNADNHSKRGTCHKYYHYPSQKKNFKLLQSKDTVSSPRYAMTSSLLLPPPLLPNKSKADFLIEYQIFCSQFTDPVL